MNTAHTSETDDAVRVVEKLLAVCTDGARGYRHAADAVSTPRLHRILARSAAQREEIAHVLTCALVELGHKPAHHGTALGAAHRGWLDVLAILSSDHPRQILRECTRGELETIQVFSAALGRGLPPNVHDVIQSQLRRVLEASATLRHEQTLLETEPSEPTR
jgi:uncharacterized protein (TIGR02284 family)